MYFSRLVVFYSQDVAYVLSLSCPEGRREENEAEFETFIDGIEIDKTPGELAPGRRSSQLGRRGRLAGAAFVQGELHYSGFWPFSVSAGDEAGFESVIS